MNILEKAIIRLLNNRGKMFYAHFLSGMRRCLDSKLPAPAGISLTDTVTLYVNPEMFEKFSEDMQTEILEHECMHLIKEHCHLMSTVPPEDRVLLNYATDCEINQYLPNINKLAKQASEDWENDELMKFITPETLSKIINKEVPYGKTSGVYFNLLKQESDKIKQELQDILDNLDDHGKMDGDGEDGKYSKELQRELVKKALDKAIKNTGVGNLPGELVSDLDKLLSSKVNWKEQLRMFYAHVNKSTKSLTRKKRNRRYGFINPGKKKVPDLHIAVGLDVSGSMSDEVLTQCFAEIRSMHQSGAKITIIEADADVQQVYDFNPKVTPKVKGRGGTAYNPACQLAKTLEVDAMIYIGDFDCADTPENPGIPFLWVGTTEQAPPASWGKVIRIPN